MVPSTPHTAGLPDPDALAKCQSDRKNFQVSFAISLTITILSLIPLLVFTVKHSRASSRATDLKKKYDAVKLSLEQCASERVFFSNLVDRLQSKLDTLKEARDPHGRADESKVHAHTEIAAKPFYEYVKNRPGGFPPTPMEIDKHVSSSNSNSNTNPFVVGSDTDSDRDGEEELNYTSPVVYTREAQLGRVRRRHYSNRRPGSIDTAASNSPIRPLIMTPGSCSSPLASSYGSSGKQKQNHNSPGGEPRLGFSQLHGSLDPIAEARIKTFLTPLHERARSSRMSAVVTEPSPLSNVILPPAPFSAGQSGVEMADVVSTTATGPIYLRTDNHNNDNAFAPRQQIDDFYETTAATISPKKEGNTATLAEAYATSQLEAETEFGTFSGVHAPTPGRRLVVTPVTSGEEDEEEEEVSPVSPAGSNEPRPRSEEVSPLSDDDDEEGEEEFPIRGGADYARQGVGGGGSI